MDKKYCLNCKEDFYNGKNPYGIQECWSLEKAKLIQRKRVGIWERPPWKAEPENLPNCYMQDGFIFVDPR